MLKEYTPPCMSSVFVFFCLFFCMSYDIPRAHVNLKKNNTLAYGFQESRPGSRPLEEVECLPSLAERA